jgi:hypothetical protein
MLSYIRRNAVAYLALFVALGGTSFAAVRLGSNSVGSKQIKPGAVGNSDLHNNAVTSGKVKNGTLTSGDFRSGTLLKGDKGDPGPSTGPAGGDLKGSYPNPTIKPLGAWSPIPTGIPCFIQGGAPPTLAYWQAAGSGLTLPEYRQDRDGVVHLRGSFKCAEYGGPSHPPNQGTPIGILPSGFRPTGTQIFPASNSGTATIVTVTPDGALLVGQAGDGTRVTVDGIEFDSLH